MSKFRFVVCCVALLGACREGPDAYSPVLSPIDSVNGTRLTFSAGRDRAPFWNKEGDTIYYSAEGVYTPLPAGKGVLVGVPAKGGHISIFLPQKQLGLANPKFFTGGSIAPNGDNVAFFELIEDPRPSVECVYFCTIRDTVYTSPQITRGVLRVAPISDQPDRDSLTVQFNTRFFDNGHSHYGLEGRWILNAMPAQRMFLRTSAQPFRPSWSPDGRQVVFSDGVQLFVFDTQTKQTRAIPGTQDAVYPAWSPTGEWIAYTRLLRSDSSVTECLCVTTRGAVADEQRRVVFNQPVIGSGALVVVKPDGSQPRILGPGDMPAWMPDGRRLVFRRGDRLWRASVDGTEAQAIVNTEDAEEPSVSPDGRFVAFVRGTLPPNQEDERLRNYDVWVVPLRVQ